MIAAEVRVVFNHLPRMSAAIRSGLGPALAQGAADGAGLARGYAPVDTGELVGSIGSRQTGPASAEFTAGTDHGLFQEYGTAHQSGTPFMRPAAAAVGPKIEAAVRSLLGGLA